MAILLNEIGMLLGHLCLHKIYNICVLLYHILQQLRYTKLWKKAFKLNLDFKRPNIVLFVVHPWTI